MQIEKAYLFARQISASGPAPLPDNVIFDNGMFNPNRMKTGFDLVNNTYLAQDVYSGISYSSGYLPIEQGG